MTNEVVTNYVVNLFILTVQWTVDQGFKEFFLFHKGFKEFCFSYFIQ